MTDELGRFNAANSLAVFLWNVGIGITYDVEVPWYDFLETLNEQ